MVIKNNIVCDNPRTSNLYLEIEFFENYIECEFYTVFDNIRDFIKKKFDLKDSDLKIKVKFKNMLALADFLEILNPKLMSMNGGLDIFIYYEGIRNYFGLYQEYKLNDKLDKFMNFLAEVTSNYNERLFEEIIE